MKVLITGIDGYIGTVLAKELIKRGHDVTGLDTGYFAEAWLGKKPKKQPKTIRKDIREIGPEDLKGFDALIHLTDLSNDPLGMLNPKTTYSINYYAGMRLAHLAKEAGVKRYIFSSSCSVYGIATVDVVDEESILNPQTDYARCKALVEQELRLIADRNFSPVILRNATVYGPSPRMRFDLVVNNLAGHAFVNNMIKLASDGTPWRPLVHIADVCGAISQILEAPKKLVHNETFNVGSQNGNYRVIEVAEMVQGIFPKAKVTIGKSNSDTRSYKVSFDKIHNKLPEFKIKYNLNKGIKELKKFFEENKLTKSKFDGRYYTRLSMLNYLLENKKIDSEFRWIDNKKTTSKSLIYTFSDL